MQELRKIISKLNRGEKKIVKDFCESKTKIGEKKKFILLSTLLNTDIDSDIEAMRLLNYEDKDTAFWDLKKTLKEDLLSLLLLQTPKAKYDDKQSQAEYACNKYLTFSTLLYDKGLNNLATKYVKKIIRLADKYELPLYLIFCYDILKAKEGLHQGIDIYEKYLKRSQEAILLYKNISEATDLAKKVLIPATHFSNTEKQLRSQSESALKRIKELQESTNSPTISYWYWRAQITYYFNHNRIIEAKATAYSFLNFLDKNPIYQKTTILGGTHLQLASICLNLKEYEIALTHSLTANKLFNKDLLNDLFSLDALFFSYLRLNRLEEADKVVQKGLQHAKVQINPILNGQWKFYKANLFFLNKSYQKAFKELRESRALMQDRSGWQFGYRILEILILYEGFGVDFIGELINNFYKLLNRQKKTAITRTKTIVKVFYLLLKHNYDFELVNKKYDEMINNLRKGEAENHWDPNGFEVLRFDEWFDSKLKRVPQSSNLNTNIKVS